MENLTSLHRLGNIHHQINFIHRAMQRTQIYLTESEHQGLWADHPAPPDLDGLRREERFADWER